MNYRAPRGTQDVLPDQAARWRFVEETFRRTCADFGYGEIRTPVFEQTDLFVRAVGEHTDIVSKEMYTVSAGGESSGESLTLRPEGTAPTLRAYLQHNLNQHGPLARLYYLASIFRHERPQSGRLRQHHQAGIEALGSEDPALDAEVIDLGLTYLHRVGVRGERLEINSVGCKACRPAYRAALREALATRIDTMCENCRRRYHTNPLRILDCKVEDWSELEPLIPDIDEHLCADCALHLKSVLGTLDALGIGFQRNKRLVRGLDYYVRTSFEVIHDSLGAQSTILGGGRYDGLVEELGGPPTPGIGFGSGIERVLLTLDALEAGPPACERAPVFVVSLGEAARIPALRLLHDLRQAGIAALADYSGRSMKAAMREANRSGARVALILGESELASGTVSWKEMETGQQSPVPLAEVVSRLGG